MTTATLTPFAKGDVSKVGRRVYRKQVLPLGTINYKGQTITFDKAFLTDLAESFNNGAYDQVPFVLADEENRHNMDPERFRGEIKGMELSSDGLDAIVEFTPEGAAVVEQNPRLGVSARIVEGLAKADGRTFKRAIQHVLGTMDPRVTGLRPWTAVDLAVYTAGEQVVDLTEATYEEIEVPKPTGTKPKDDEKVEDAPAKGAAEEETPPVGEAEAEGDTPAEGEQPLDLGQLTDEEFAALLADAESGEEDEEPEEKPEAGGAVRADLSTSDNAEVKQMRQDLAKERWDSKRKDLVRRGVPPFMLDLAEPVLSSPDAVIIDLSTSDDPVDAKAVITALVEGMQGIVDIRPEVGHQVDLSEDNSDAALLAAWENGNF